MLSLKANIVFEYVKAFIFITLIVRLNKMTRAAIIGLGLIGFQYGLEKGRVYPASHYHCYRHLFENGMLTDIAVCDSDKVKLAGFSENMFTNYHEMMQKFNPEIVSICTPTNTHAGITCDIASYPSIRAILLEKPMAESLEDADKIIKACINNNVRLSVNYSRRWSGDFRTLQVFCKSSAKRFCTAIGLHPGPLLRTGTHMLDLFNWCFGDPVHVQAFGILWANYVTQKVLEGNLDYNISGVISYQHGHLAILSSNKSRPYVLFEVDVLSDGGRMRIVDNGEQTDFYAVRPSRRYENLKELKLVRRESPGEVHSTLLRAIEETVHSAGAEKPSNFVNSCSGEDARNTLQVALALHYSAMHKNKIVRVSEVPRDYKVESY